MRGQRAPPPVPLVDTKALPLPPLDGDLERGKHDGLLGYLAGTDRQVTTTADSGAQAPAVSLRCASLGWREQERLADTSGDPSKARALTGCERMPVPQRFYGFKGPEGDHEEVDIVGELGIRLDGAHADTGEPMSVEVVIPQCRVCPVQEDDILLADPILKDLKWELGRDSIIFHELGKIRVPLSTAVKPW